ncbi:MAG: hypothetical protein ACR2M0_00035 [Chloroflexia bacterium]
MAHIKHRFAPVLLLLLLLTPFSPAASAAPQRQDTPPRLLTDPVPDPHQPGVKWFPATGHTLRGAFLDYWMRYGSLAQFGYPLTKEFFDGSGPGNKPLQVQYFERNRFEYHPENSGNPYTVLLGTLGLSFHPADPPAPRPADPAALYFEQTGHSLSGAFKKLWQSHSGLFVHGYPITEPISETNPTDGKTYTVQYFERSRFELHHENAGTPYEVLLGLLGTQLAQKQGYPYGWYPRFGHAADWSWVAGQIELYLLPGGCMPCGCSLFRIDETGTHFQLDPGVREVGSAIARRALLAPYPHAVIFGRLAKSNEYGHSCLEDWHATEYLVESIQLNPAP